MVAMAMSGNRWTRPVPGATMAAMELDPDICYRALVSRDARFDGRFFIAVKTTRVYCRPICPARTARRENVSFFASAAAAQEAGFRPCLRCRPEAAPDSGAWRAVSNTGVSHTVTRALALIEAGALDDSGVAELADRLGVGERQLRRLFATHVGASVLTVATTRRVLLAQQLINETALPLTEIAFAAGFGSVRRFNEVFQDLFKRPPSELRRACRPEQAGEISLLLRYRPPYDWPSMLSFLTPRAIAGIETVADGVYHRTFDLDGVVGALSVAPDGSDALRVTIRGGSRLPLSPLIARVRAQFDLAADPQIIESQLGRDALLAPLLQARPGLRLPGSWDGFELAVRAVLNQQITTAGAIRIAGKLVERFGKPLAEPLAPGLTHVFPTAACLAQADLDTLGMPAARRLALKEVAALAASRPELFALHADREQTLTALRAIRGIGDWTAQYVALRGLRDPDAFPAGDVVLRKALARLTGAECDERQARALAEAWRPWRGYAAQYLWGA